MTKDEQQQVNAAMAYMESQIANLAREGANKAIQCEILAQRLKVAEDRVKELEPKSAPELKAVE